MNNVWTVGWGNLIAYKMKSLHGKPNAMPVKQLLIGALLLLMPEINSNVFILLPDFSFILQFTYQNLFVEVLAEWAWMIETYHRGIKQFCGIERCQARSETAQRNHIELALRAFLRLEFHCFVKGIRLC